VRAHTHAHRLDNGAAHEVGTWQGLTYTWGLRLLHFMRAVTHSDSLPQFATFGQYVWDVCGESVLHVSFTHKMRHNLLVKHGNHTWQVERASFTCGTWLTHLWDMTHSHVGHDSFICGTWLIHMWGMTHSHVGHDSFICGTWLIHMWGMTHSHVGHDSFTCPVASR